MIFKHFGVLCRARFCGKKTHLMKRDLLGNLCDETLCQKFQPYATYAYSMSHTLTRININLEIGGFQKQYSGDIIAYGARKIEQ